MHVKTKGPNPLLPNNLTNMFMMDKEWSEANNAAKVQDFKNKEENFAVRNANGTGPVRARLARAGREDRDEAQRRLLGQAATVPLEITEIIYTPIKADATRIAALLSGEVDFVQDVPVQDIERLKSTPNLARHDRAREPHHLPRHGRRLAGSEVRQRQGQEPVRGQAGAAGHEHGDQPRRHPARRDARPVGAGGRDRAAVRERLHQGTRQRPPTDVARAKALLAEAGYRHGFQVTLNCPNDRYVNDEGICQAVVGMMGQIGIKVNLVSQSKTLHFPLCRRTRRRRSSTCVGWGVPTFDSEYIFSFLYHTRDAKFGSWNALRYSNADLDRKIESLSSEIDAQKRNATIARDLEDRAGARRSTCRSTTRRSPTP